MVLLSIAALMVMAVVGSRGQSVPPRSGVLLFSETEDIVLANNSFVSSARVSQQHQGIACYTAAGDGITIPPDAMWEDIEGREIPQSSSSSSGSLVVYTQPRPQHILLHRGGAEFTVDNEGVYTCHINDENDDRQTLLIGIYTPETFLNIDGPVVETPVFTLLTEFTTHPSHFTITCPSSSVPPLSTNWSIDGTPVTPDGGEYSTSQVLVDPATSLYDNVLSVSGDLVGVYRCDVGNEEGMDNASLAVRVPSGPPREVRAVPGGAGSVRVTWTHPPGGASGYVIFYSPSSPMADHTLSVQVDDPEATSHTIQSMMTQTEYTIQMLAYAELSTALSDSTTVYLDVPDQPTNVVATPTLTFGIRVQWEGPQNEADVDGYVIEYKPDATATCDGVSDGEEVVMGAGEREREVKKGLEEGTDYVVRVLAFNFMGRGEFSQPPVTVYTREKAPTGAPLNVSVTPVPPDTLSVMWQPPDCQLWNSHRLTNYTLHYSPILTLSQGGEEVSIQVVDGLCFNLTGLTNFTDYRVSVYASNGEGRGPTSQEVVTSLITVTSTDQPTDIGRATEKSDVILTVVHVIAGVVGVAVAAVIIVLVLRLLVVVCEKKNNQKVVSDGDVIYKTPGSGDNLHTTENTAYGVTTKSAVTTHDPTYDIVLSKANEAAEDCPGESGMESSVAATDNAVHMQSNPVYNLHPSNVQQIEEMEYDYVM